MPLLLLMINMEICLTFKLEGDTQWVAGLDLPINDFITKMLSKSYQVKNITDTLQYFPRSIQRVRVL